MSSKFFRRLEWLERPPENFRDALQVALDMQDAKNLHRLARRALNEAQLHQLGKAFSKSCADGKTWTGLIRFRLAMLSNGTTSHLLLPLIATALRYGIQLEILAFSYNEAYTVGLGSDERLSAFAPDAVLIAMDHQCLPIGTAVGEATHEKKQIENCQHYIQALLDGIRSRMATTCIVQTCALPAAGNFGHADRKIHSSKLRIVNALNDFISQAADVVLDIHTLAGIVGTSEWFDANLAHAAKMPFSLQFVPLYAEHVCRLIGALRGKNKKVLVLDLDNTLWGGVVGDDGVEGIAIGNGSASGEAFLDFQKKALSLRNRGILLAVSSKNDEEQARRPFRELPDMVLKEDSFSAFRANWNDKAANIQAIAEELSLGLDSFVFVDDNPAERELVRQFLPDVAVPELPDDPALYALTLDAAGYFETMTYSEEDAKRADLYQSRGLIAKLSSNELGQYLASLEMKLTVDKAGATNRSRVSQLINKSNQFNLTTQRYTEQDIRELEDSGTDLVFSLRLCDRLDDHGIISVLICSLDNDQLAIKLWVMSCRVIGRQVERATLSFLTEIAAKRKCTKILGKYIPSARNAMVEKHYQQLGFKQVRLHDDGATDWEWHVEDGVAIAADAVAVIDNT